MTTTSGSDKKTKVCSWKTNPPLKQKKMWWLRRIERKQDDMRRFYETVNCVRRKTAPSPVMCKHRDGNLLSWQIKQCNSGCTLWYCWTVGIVEWHTKFESMTTDRLWNFQRLTRPRQPLENWRTTRLPRRMKHGSEHWATVSILTTYYIETMRRGKTA